MLLHQGDLLSGGKDAGYDSSYTLYIAVFRYAVVGMKSNVPYNVGALVKVNLFGLWRTSAVTQNQGGFSFYIIFHGFPRSLPSTAMKICEIRSRDGLIFFLHIILIFGRWVCLIYKARRLLHQFCIMLCEKSFQPSIKHFLRHSVFLYRKLFSTINKFYRRNKAPMSQIKFIFINYFFVQQL